MYYAAKERREGWRALASVAAIVAGFALSQATSPALHLGAETGDVVGVWRWVDPAGERSPSVTPLFEIRRGADGALEAMVLVSPGDRVREADISFTEGHLCMVTQHGASFQGELSEDGRVIDGVIQFDGARASAQLQRVEHRKMRRAAGRKTYAT